MKKLFYFGCLGLALFEILNVYFIMPMPGSQQMESLGIAYFLYGYRWFFRIVFAILIVVGASKAFSIRHKWLPVIPLLLAGLIAYYFNFVMSADSMFKEPGNLTFKPRDGNLLPDSSVVIGVEHNGEAKAYPVRFIVYHHQVQDNVGGKPFIITYCSVCRTGRVFEPIVNNKEEKFRLVGMDHFNAMFEDATTKSWWRQATGEAVAGPLKGQSLPEVESTQATVGKWFELYPNALIMQRDDKTLVTNYDTLGRFERGKSKGSLTRTDSLSWKDKSWVVGIQIGSESKAYDWIKLKEQHVISDNVGNTPVVVVLSGDEQSFAAFERPGDAKDFRVSNDTIYSNDLAYDFAGRSLTLEGKPLKKLKAYQEFWHSWRTFHPNTVQYDVKP